MAPAAGLLTCTCATRPLACAAATCALLSRRRPRPAGPHSAGEYVFAEVNPFLLDTDSMSKGRELFRRGVLVVIILCLHRPQQPPRLCVARAALALGLQRQHSLCSAGGTSHPSNT